MVEPTSAGHLARVSCAPGKPRRLKNPPRSGLWNRTPQAVNPRRGVAYATPKAPPQGNPTPGPQRPTAGPAVALGTWPGLLSRAPFIWKKERKPAARAPTATKHGSKSSKSSCHARGPVAANPNRHEQGELAASDRSGVYFGFWLLVPTPRPTTAPPQHARFCSSLGAHVTCTNRRSREHKARRKRAKQQRSKSALEFLVLWH